MEFPRSLFKSPGDQWVGGGSFAIEHVEDMAQYHAAKKAGWFDSVPEALASWKASLAAPVVADDAPPTRAEMEQQAKKLGIKFDGRTTDAALLRKISEA
jgi:hypothetical protein